MIIEKFVQQPHLMRQHQHISTTLFDSTSMDPPVDKPLLMWDILNWNETVQPSRQDARNRTFGCGVYFFDFLCTIPPLKDCTAEQLSKAFLLANRTGPSTSLLVPGCRLQWWQGSRACALIQEAGGLDLRGDSLMRHLHQSIIELLTNDLGDGTSRHVGARCACDSAYDDGHSSQPGEFLNENNKFCRENTVALLSLAALRSTWPDYCIAWGDTQFIPIHDWEINEKPDPVRFGSVVVLQGGLHSSDLSEKSAEYFFGPQRLKRGARRHIFLNQMAPGDNKARQFLSNFGLEPTKEFNKYIEKKATEAKALLLDGFSATFRQNSIDGQHYYHDTNLILAQLLLNLLAAIVQEPSIDSFAAMNLAESVRV